MKEIYDQVGRLILLQEVIQGHISNKLGPQVAEQFTNTFLGGDDFSSQNFNALIQIRNEINRLLDAGIFSTELEFIESYRHELEHHIVSNYSLY